MLNPSTEGQQQRVIGAALMVREIGSSDSVGERQAYDLDGVSFAAQLHRAWGEWLHLWANQRGPAGLETPTGPSCVLTVGSNTGGRIDSVAEVHNLSLIIAHLSGDDFTTMDLL